MNAETKRLIAAAVVHGQGRANREGKRQCIYLDMHVAPRAYVRPFDEAVPPGTRFVGNVDPS